MIFNAPSLPSLLRPLVAVSAFAVCASTGCSSGKSEPTKESSPPAQQPPAANIAPSGAAIGGGPSVALGGGGTPAPATAGPNGRSAVPTQDEWSSAKEVGVKGSTKLNCETKMVREWLRVSCRGKNDTGGEAKNVTLKKGGGRGDTFTFASNKVASLICPFVDGTDLVAVFEWTDKKQELVVSWPHGAPMPPTKGEFR